MYLRLLLSFREREATGKGLKALPGHRVHELQREGSNWERIERLGQLREHLVDALKLEATGKGLKGLPQHGRLSGRGEGKQLGKD